MNNYRKEIAFGTVMLVIFVGLLIWYMTSTTQSGLSIMIAMIIILVGVVTFVLQIVNKRRDMEAGTPAEDEFTKIAKVYAGSRAFIYSMYLWMLIFVFNSAFTKPQTMLGIGILGSALIYGLWLFYFKTTGEMYEE
jgi:uncharacterized membrane protein